MKTNHCKQNYRGHGKKDDGFLNVLIGINIRSFRRFLIAGLFSRSILLKLMQGVINIVSVKWVAIYSIVFIHSLE